MAEKPVDHHDEDATAFFKEVDDDINKDYMTCSASQAFDSVWQCYTLGSQAVNYYRYGEKKDCSVRWEDFKFCMSAKTKSSEVADRMLRQRAKEKERLKSQMRNSEEVWEAYKKSPAA